MPNLSRTLKPLHLDIFMLYITLHFVSKSPRSSFWTSEQGILTNKLRGWFVDRNERLDLRKLGSWSSFQWYYNFLPDTEIVMKIRWRDQVDLLLNFDSYNLSLLTTNPISTFSLGKHFDIHLKQKSLKPHDQKVKYRLISKKRKLQHSVFPCCHQP